MQSPLSIQELCSIRHQGPTHSGPAEISIHTSNRRRSYSSPARGLCRYHQQISPFLEPQFRSIRYGSPTSRDKPLATALSFPSGGKGSTKTHRIEVGGVRQSRPSPDKSGKSFPALSLTTNQVLEPFRRRLGAFCACQSIEYFLRLILGYRSVAVCAVNDVLYGKACLVGYRLSISEYVSIPTFKFRV